MRLIRYRKNSEPPQYGWVNDLIIGQLVGSPFGEYQRLEATLPLDSVQLLAPILPGKIICVGRNYTEHIKETNAEVPTTPLLFLKPPSAVIGPNQTIFLPPQSEQVDHEAELAVVIGRRGRWIQPPDAGNYIFGYTIGNDVTARDLQRKDGQWTRSKGFDTFLPLGPWIDTDINPSDTMITCHVNGQLRQMASTRDMIFHIDQLIAYVSSIMTLEPGDVLMTGTPAGISPLHPGDTVEVSIEGIGKLCNTVAVEVQS
ncbi:MAG: 2-hydroxyhepta-2,4-diene-1,7-dioate isomerase [Anaerolineales bacterium]|nr:MAG: 2-hydroxyhepta-2,4-diene-1,7-dioate isomerase [Anaerolineales bacterium]